MGRVQPVWLPRSKVKFGIYSSVSQQFVFGIQEQTPKAAWSRLREKIGSDALKWRFSCRMIDPASFPEWRAVKVIKQPKPNQKEKCKMAIKAKRKGTLVVTGVVRASYANIWEPKSVNGGDPKYSISLIIPKDDESTVKAIQEAIEEAKQNGKDKWGGKVPGGIKTPLRDGDEEREDDPAYANSYFINANSNHAPQIVDGYKNKITDETAVYSGCYIRASVNFYAFNRNGNKGIAAGLGNIQKVRDGEPLGGGTTAASDFDELDFEDDDDLI